MVPANAALETVDLGPPAGSASALNFIAGRIAEVRQERVAGELRRYGEEEGTVLRTAILDAVSRESGRVATPSGLAITGLARPLGGCATGDRPVRRQAGRRLQSSAAGRELTATPLRAGWALR